jgi:hypothetical protein
MIALLDACTLINLLLCVNDAKYIMYTERAFNEIIILDKVYAELKANRNDNGVDESFKEEYEKIIFSYLNTFIRHNPNRDAIEFVKSFLDYNDENGELISVSEGLFVSRFGSDKNKRDCLLQVHFITDDGPATEQFQEFYEFNHIGKILSSIDLLVILSFKNFVTRNEVIRYCQALKSLYNRPSSILNKELKLLVEKDQISSAKERLIVTKCIEILDDLGDDTNEQLSLLLEKPECQTLLRDRRYLKRLFEEVLESNFRKKIPAINEKKKTLESLWMFDYLN